MKNNNGRIDTIRKVINDQRADEQKLREKHPWFDLAYNYLVAALLVAAFACLIIQIVQLQTEKKAASLAATAFAEYQAEQEAQAQAEAEALEAQKLSAEEQMKENARSLAKLLYGVRNFEAKYGYTNDDLITLVRCVLNRTESKEFPDTINGVLAQEGQWIAYSEDNPVLGNYYKLAYNALEDYRYEETKPCDTGFLWALVDEDGIWLIDGFGGSYNKWNNGQGVVRVVTK